MAKRSIRAKNAHLEGFDLIDEIDDLSNEIEMNQNSQDKMEMLSFHIEDDDIDVNFDEISYKHAALDIVSNSFFSMLGIMTQFLVVMVNQVFLGHISDPDVLAGYGLGHFTMVVVAFAFSFNFNGSIETLVSQANGNKDYYL